MFTDRQAEAALVKASPWRDQAQTVGADPIERGHRRWQVHRHNYRQPRGRLRRVEPSERKSKSKSGWGMRRECRAVGLRAQDRARSREGLLAATERELDKVVQMVGAGRLGEADKIGLRVGRVVNRFKMAKHFQLEVQRDGFAYRRKQESIRSEAALDGLYAIRTSLTAEQMEAAKVVRSYKQLAKVEREFRVIKGSALELAPIRHRLTERIAAHFLICQLAAYVRWQMERDLAPLLFKDQYPLCPQDPVAPAQRSAAAERKARSKRNSDGLAVKSFASLLDELGSLTKNLIAPIGAKEACFWQLSQPTQLQERAFELPGVRLGVAKTPAP